MYVRCNEKCVYLGMGRNLLAAIPDTGDLILKNKKDPRVEALKANDIISPGQFGPIGNEK